MKHASIFIALLCTIFLTACTNNSTKVKGVVVKQDYKSAVKQLIKAGCIMTYQSEYSSYFNCDFFDNECTMIVEKNADESVKEINIILMKLFFDHTEDLLESPNKDFFQYATIQYSEKYGDYTESIKENKSQITITRTFDLEDVRISLIRFIERYQYVSGASDKTTVTYTPKPSKSKNTRYDI